MSDNRPAAADDRSLVRVPCRWCVATGGALSSVSGVFSLAGCAAISWVEEGAFSWLVSRVCGVLTPPRLVACPNVRVHP